MSTQMQSREYNWDLVTSAVAIAILQGKVEEAHYYLKSINDNRLSDIERGQLEGMLFVLDALVNE